MAEEIFFSVCLPTYNRASFLKKCIESVISQTYSNFELIITDNQSTDNTKEIVSSFSDDRIRFFENENNVGLWGNHNICIEKSQGAWVVFLHSDESLKANALKLIAESIQRSDETPGVIFGIPDRPSTWDLVKQPFFSNNLLKPISLLAVMIGIGNPSGMCFYKDTLKEIGMYSTEGNIYFLADHLVLAKLANAGYPLLAIDDSIIDFEPGEHQESYTLHQKTRYQSLKYYYNFLQRCTGFEEAFKLFLDHYDNWSTSTITRVSFGISTLNKKRVPLKFLAKAFNRIRVFLKRQMLYALGNSIFGNKFYPFVLKMGGRK
jgi:glycosyltransferase involved in cell wall biosynthesis